MRKQVLLAFGSVCVILLFVMVLSAACAPATPAPAPSKPAAPAVRSNYLVGSTSASSGTYPHVVKKAEIWSRETPYNFTVVETGATYDNIDRMSRGELALAAATTLVASEEAYKGTGSFKDRKPFSSIRILYNYANSPNLWVVRADSGITDMKQLSGKPYGAGLAGASSTQSVYLTFQALGLDASKLQAGATADLVNAVLDNRLSGVTKTCANVQLDASLLQIQSATPIRALSYTEEQWAAFHKADPLNQWPKYNYPANFLKALPGHGPIICGGMITSVIAHADLLPQEVGYRAIKASFERWDEWGALVASAMGFDRMKFQWEVWPPAPHIPLHAGAVQYFKERGIDVPPEFIPPEYKAK